MKLYHFTAARNLRGIAKFGLTVGDVPTDLRKNLGRVGVWLTSMPEPEGHGLCGERTGKSHIRLEIDYTHLRLVKWSDWAPINATRHTINGLHSSANNFDSWYICFGLIAPSDIISCTDMSTGTELVDWSTAIPPQPTDSPGVPFWRRGAWHKKLLRDCAAVMAPQTLHIAL